MANDQEKAFRAELRSQLKSKTAIQTNTRDEIVRLLKVASEQIQITLAGQPTDYQQWQLGNLQKEINRVMAVYGAGSAQVVSGAADKTWKAGADLVEKTVSAGGVHIAGILPTIDTRQLDAMSSFMTGRIADIGVQAANKINTELGLVVLGVQTPHDAAGKVSEIMGAKSRDRATMIVRTELNRVYNVASFQKLLQAQKTIPGLGKQWRRSGKLHSRLNHDAADGQVQDVDQPFVILGKSGAIVKMMHPHDPTAPAEEVINCGCIAIPFMKSWNKTIPGRKPYSQEEQRNPIKRDIEQARNGPTVARLLQNQQDAIIDAVNATKPDRTAWEDFPDVLILAPDDQVLKHPNYAAAKAGSVDSAIQLVEAYLTPERIAALSHAVAGRLPVVAGVQAVEGNSVNVIPEVMASWIADALDLTVDAHVIQANRVSHTKADGFARIGRPAIFSGEVQAGMDYLIVDDFIGQGGTVANFRGYIEANGGRVILSSTLTGRSYSAKIALSAETLTKLREKYYAEKLEEWWIARFGYGFELLTESEARFLIKAQDAQAVRAGIAAAVQG